MRHLLTIFGELTALVCIFSLPVWLPLVLGALL